MKQYKSLKHLTLKYIFLEYKLKIILTLFLVILENILYLLFPLVLGFAINGLIESNYFWLIGLTILGLADMLITAIRKFYDTRVYGKIYHELSPYVVEKEHKKTNDFSKVNARLDMLEELIDFFEEILPELIGLGINIFGTLLILYFLDLNIFTLALIVVCLVMGIYRFTKNKTLRFHKNLNDVTETQVDMIKKNSKSHTSIYSRKLMKCYINLSDLEAINFAVSFTLLLLLISSSLYLIVKSGITDAGAIFSIVVYLYNFLYDVTMMPEFYQTYIRLTEIMGRLK